MIELIIMFLIQVIASHYIERSLAAIDTHLVNLIKTGAGIPEIKAYIQGNKEIEARVVDFTGRIMERSHILPMVPEGSVTNEDKAELFLQVLKIGYGFSHFVKSNLMLPGSLIGPAIFTFFTDNNKSVPKLARKGVEIDIDKAASSKDSNMLYMLPLLSKEKRVEMWNNYKTEFKAAKGDLSTGYFSSYSQFYRGYPRVTRVTAEYCYLVAYGLEQNAMDALQLEPLSISLSEAEKLHKGGRGIAIGRARIQQWYEGIQAMISGIKELSSLLVLPEDEVSKINQIWDGLKALFESRED